MSAETITQGLLRGWPLPEPGSGEYGRGQIVILGGAPRSPAAAMLGSLAALRVGAGWLTIALRASVAGAVAVTIPKCGVVPLQETNDGHIDGGLLQAATTDLQVADALLVGPGPDDADAA